MNIGGNIIKNVTGRNIFSFGSLAAKKNQIFLADSLPNVRKGILDVAGDGNYKMKREKIVFKTEWFKIGRIRGTKEIDSDKPFYRLVENSSVSILAITENRQVVLVKQFRPALGKTTLELPSGAIDGSETPKRAAIRELLEETGYSCKKISSIVSNLPIMTGRSNCLASIFLGVGAKEVKHSILEENIETVLMPINQFKRMVKKGKFKFWPAIVALSLAELNNIKYS